MSCADPNGHDRRQRAGRSRRARPNLTLTVRPTMSTSTRSPLGTDDDLRPVCQGDVYSGICLPTYDGEHYHVILAMQPCSRRAGALLRHVPSVRGKRTPVRRPLEVAGTALRK